MQRAALSVFKKSIIVGATQNSNRLKTEISVYQLEEDNKTVPKKSREGLRHRLVSYLSALVRFNN